MRYVAHMGMLIPATAALIAAASPIAGGLSPTPAAIVPASSPAMRFDASAAATVTISARIVREAGVGAHRGPPVPGMLPRHTTVIAADGRAVAALIYDFE